MPANPNPGSNVYTAYTGPNKYGSSPKDSNREPINFSNAISTQDYTGRALATPDSTQDLTSPLALGVTTNAVAITVPPNAVQMTLIGAVAFSISEFGTPGAALTQYASIPANSPIKLDMARIKTLYVAGTGTTGALSFLFQTL